jgi:hypothetical protein
LPTSPQHRAKAENNEFLTTQINNPFWDWGVTANFYSALHYVEAYFASKTPQLHPPTHTLRDNHIHADSKLSPIYIDYRQLEDESRDARYDASVTISQSDFVRTQGYLNRIKTVIIPLLP